MSPIEIIVLIGAAIALVVFGIILGERSPKARYWAAQAELLLTEAKHRALDLEHKLLEHKASQSAPPSSAPAVTPKPADPPTAAPPTPT